MHVVISFESAPAGVICYCKITSVMTLEGVTSFLRLKYFTFLQCNGDKLEEAEYFKCVFVVNYVFESK